VNPDFAALPQLPCDRRWRRQTSPQPVVVALIRRETGAEAQFLLIRRKSKTYGGQWALVGGKWDFGETLPVAICREVVEETSLQTSFVTLAGLVNERLAPTHPQQIGAHFTIFVCRLAVVSGRAAEQEEGAVGWFSWAEINEMAARQAVIPSDFAMLQQFGDPQSEFAHFEVEMAAAIGTALDDSARLLRFDRVG
jgi:8-oxo-dGTP diphosphatase